MAQEHVIRFKDKHDLDLYVYDASDARIRYDTLFMGFYEKENESDPRDIAPGKSPWDEERQKVTMGLFPIFGGLVRLSWHDLRDNFIEYTFNFDEIFPDRIIPHPKALDDRIFWSEPLAYTPGIILEIIDRRLNIYTVIDLHVQIPNTNTVKTKTYRAKVFTREF
ncbi:MULTISPECIES: hypothetical protein [Syntrophotalea]|jgi:hypothetical protein|uniref:Uncharacterized protein n=1 Tax=Syntrophotalea acetylenica TaxID=29542 RepID=A0A1L3GDG3_SYNAC|nr:hypothetical protein [Syntrophotalea acetylenica]APG23875.1 hypothetical protein A7E75_01670 [Syntrophotalea acetylenica]APG44456.1 hypothetical protein A6070_10285 [Syntrophotalea acetylenica]